MGKKLQNLVDRASEAGYLHIDKNMSQIIDDFIFVGSNNTEEAIERITNKMEFRRGQYLFYHMFYKRWESFKSL